MNDQDHALPETGATAAMAGGADSGPLQAADSALDAVGAAGDSAAAADMAGMADTGGVPDMTGMAEVAGAAGDQGWAAAALGLLDAGGPVMYVLAGLSVIALTVILYKLLHFVSVRLWSRRQVRRALEAWHAGRWDEAVPALQASRHPVARVLMTAVVGQDRSPETAREEVERVAGLELDALQAGLRLLAIIATLSPLLGLLGTVIGMIDAFQALEAAGNKVDPAILSGGIWVALLTTAAGLVVAIPAAAAHQWLEGVVEAVGRAMEDAASQIFTHQPARRLAALRATTGAAE
jgi:biopolymer transport protein ExbB